MRRERKEMYVSIYRPSERTCRAESHANLMEMIRLFLRVLFARARDVCYDAHTHTLNAFRVGDGTDAEEDRRHTRRAMRR